MLLLVEDNAQKARVLQRCLERAGFQVCRVETLTAARAAFDGGPWVPRGVVTDWHFPREPGESPAALGGMVVWWAQRAKVPVAIVSADFPQGDTPCPWFGPDRWVEVADWMKIQLPG